MSKRTDGNHSEIVTGLRAVGAFVQSIASVGRGCPDVICAYRGRWYVAELKDGSKPPSHRRLTEAEKVWHEQVGDRAPIYIWESLDEALAVINAA